MLSETFNVLSLGNAVRGRKRMVEVGRDPAQWPYWAEEAVLPIRKRSIQPFHALPWLGLMWLLLPIGCSSKQEEVALAPPSAATAPPTTPAPAANSVNDDDGATNEEEGDDSTTTEDDESMNEDDGSLNEDDGSMNEDDGSMNEDDGSMNEDDGSMNEDDGDGSGFVRAKPKNLREQAEQAFGDGFERAAYRLLQAHLLSSEADAAELISQYRWSPSRRQPQLGVRIAAGVELTAPSEIKDYKPIGSLPGFFSNRKSPSRKRNEGEDDDGHENSSSLATLFATNNQERVLQKYTGLMGDVLVDHLRSSHSQGSWAPVFQSLSGVVSKKVSFESGDGSDDGSGSDDDSENMNGNNAGKAVLATKIDGAEAEYISVGPVLTFIGTGKTSELLEKAKAGEFDALVVFEVKVTLNMKIRMIYNECKAKLINFADGKILAVSKQLKNTESQKEIDKAGLEFVNGAMQPILKKLDEGVALKEIPPALTPEMIKSKRLGVLVSDQSRSKLDLLAEIRLYREKALLTDEEIQSAYESILGLEDGRALANGPDEERLKVVMKLLSGTSSAVPAEQP